MREWFIHSFIQTGLSISVKSIGKFFFKLTEVTKGLPTRKDYFNACSTTKKNIFLPSLLYRRFF